MSILKSIFICGVCFWTPCQPDEPDPCGIHKALSPDVISGGIQCTSSLTSGWYRYTGNLNGHFTTVCPASDHKTNITSIWMQDIVPSEREGVTDVNVCIKVKEDCCSIANTMKLKNCSDFIVFYHRRVPMCPYKYSFEHMYTTTHTSIDYVTSTQPEENAHEIQESDNTVTLALIVSGCVVGAVIIAILLAVFLCRDRTKRNVVVPSAPETVSQMMLHHIYPERYATRGVPQNSCSKNATLTSVRAVPLSGRPRWK